MPPMASKASVLGSGTYSTTYDFGEPGSILAASFQVAARGGDNLFPPILAAVEALATVGEIAGRLRSVFGEYRESFAL